MIADNLEIKNEYIIKSNLKTFSKINKWILIER